MLTKSILGRNENGLIIVFWGGGGMIGIYI